MSQYWYIERRHELLVDLDRATPRTLDSVQRRLEAGERLGTLPATAAYLYPSEGDDHWHLYVRLTRDLPFPERVAWALRLGDDRSRAGRNLLRHMSEQPAPSLLIEPGALPEYPRIADNICECTEKHASDVMAACPVGRLLRPVDDIFGRLTPAAGPRWARVGQVWPEQRERNDSE